MADSKRMDDYFDVRPKVVDTHQDYPAIIDYRLILVFLVVAAVLFGA